MLFYNLYIMAKKPYYIYDLPFQPRRELCRILDADRRWEELGGIHMHVDVTTLTLIGQAVQRDKSPAWELLSLWGERNGTIKQLFVMLAKMDHQRGMTILLPYVDEKYRKLIRDGSAATADHSKKFSGKDFSKPSASTHQISDSEAGASCMSLLSFSDNDASTLTSLTSHSKLNDLLNINHDMSSVSIQSKLNILNPQHHSKGISKQSPQKSPGLRNVKAEAANCEESITDNCVSEKIKNVSQPSLLSQADKNNMSNAAGDQENGSNLQVIAEKSLPEVMKISYQDIEKATDAFDKSRILGRGGFGAVYRGEWKGTSVAIKRLMPKDGNHSGSKHLVSLKQSLNELKILMGCRFDHILPLYGVSLDGPEPCLVYQLMVNGSLEDRLLCRSNTPPLTWSQRSSIAECTTKGLNYLHTVPGKALVHGDIKSANILLDANMEAKIGDFGLTREGPSSQATHVKVSKLHGTECYLPPEYLRHRQLSPQVDVYSYGIVLLEMATGLRPYDNKRDEAKLLVDYVSDCRESGRLDSLRDPKAGEENMMWFGELIKIGQECSSRDKKKRPTMQRVLGWFDKIKEEISMVDKIRRMSNERNSLGDTSKLKHLTPRELQIFYDMCKEKCAITGASVAPSESLNLPPNIQNNLSAVTSGPGSKSVHVPVEESSEPRISHNTGGSESDSVSQQVDNNMIPDAGPSVPAEFCCQNVVENSNSPDGSGGPPSNGKAPVPLLTVLQLQVSDVCENSSYTDTSKTEASNSNMSNEYSSCEYSEDSAM